MDCNEYETYINDIGCKLQNSVNIDKLRTNLESNYKNTPIKKVNLKINIGSIENDPELKQTQVELSLSPLNKLKNSSNQRVVKLRPRLSSGGSAGGLSNFSKLLKHSCKALQEVSLFTITTRNNKKDAEEEFQLEIKTAKQEKDVNDDNLSKINSEDVSSHSGVSNFKSEKIISIKVISANSEPEDTAFYSEEDKFIDELSEEYKKYYINTVDNCYGNYDIYVTNSLMLTTILPDKDYFLQEINKKKISFKRSPFKKLMLLDLDETLIHTDFDYKFKTHDVYLNMKMDDGEEVLPINIRPYLSEFLAFSSKFFDVLIFTASQRKYAEVIVNHIDPERAYIKDIIDRESCVIYKNLFLKFPEILDVPLKDCVIIDNSIFSFAHHLSNGILVTSFYNESDDQDLYSLIEFLEAGVVKTSDVRDVIENTFEFMKIKESLKNLPDNVYS